MKGAQGEPAATQRIDKWLFFARIVKSRSLAAKMVQSGRVRVNCDKVSNAARAIRPGDVLTVSLERRVVVLKVLAAGERRGPYSEARLLYEDLTPPEPPPETAPPPANAGVREQGSGRPTKKQRRMLDSWRGGE